MNHRVVSVYVNLVAAWQCRRCGSRWAASSDPAALEALPCQRRR